MSARAPVIIPLEPQYAPGASMRQMVLLLTVFGVLYGAGLVVIGLAGFGVIQ